MTYFKDYSFAINIESPWRGKKRYRFDGVTLWLDSTITFFSKKEAVYKDYSPKTYKKITNIFVTFILLTYISICQSLLGLN